MFAYVTKALVFLACITLQIAHAQVDAAARPQSAGPLEFSIANFQTESGVVLPKAIVVYGTYGKLNAARDNVVLLPSHYMANYHGYEWLERIARSILHSCF